MELVDTQWEDGSFTWFKGDNQEAASRIDRFLLSSEWDGSFRNIKQVPLQRLVSDHVPIALQCGSWEVPKSNFKFQNWWLTKEGFVDKVSDWWNSFEFSGRPDYILASKLKALKEKLKEWSRSDQGSLKLQKSRLLNQMADLDSILDSRIMTEEEIAKKAELYWNWKKS
uniref:Non-LTR retroelement reverse transcriptase n=1 Tax=Solanum tuberosum TaxID=4113 RepID=M1BXT6_SOLTU